MYTVCPKCALTLVVTTADLRVAQGYVRCGRCASVFNALAALSEAPEPAGTRTRTSATGPATRPSERELDLAASSPADRPEVESGPIDFDFTTPAQQTKSAQQEAPIEIELPAPEPTQSPAPPQPSAQSADTAQTTEEDEAIPDAALEFDPVATDVSEVFVEPPRGPQEDAVGTIETIILESAEDGESDRSSDDPTDEFAIDPGLRALAAEIESTGVSESAPTESPAPAPPTPAKPEAAPGAALSSIPAAVGRTTDAGRTAAAEPPRSEAPKTQTAPVAGHEAVRETEDFDTAEALVAIDRTQRRATALWGIGAVLLLLLLAAQVIHYHRHELAADPRLNGPLTALYAAMGIELVPRWDLSAYDVRQLGAFADPSGSGRLTVRASLKNSASQAQPLPLLRVTLQDRFGNRIASRDVEPEHYVPSSVPPGALLAAGQRIDAEMTFADPGKEAVGFELDACLRSASGEIRCAADLRGR